MPKQYMVELAQDERDELEAVLKSSTRRAVSATKLQRARILLAVGQGGAGQWHSFSDHCHSFKEVPFTPVWNASPMLS